MENNFKVVEKFVSIDGEGVRVGQPVVFIRFVGCNLKCSYCDTDYAQSKGTCNYENMSEDDICKYIASTGITNVTLTGGEPLIQPGVTKLIDLLENSGYKVNIETNGSVDVELAGRASIVTMDYKLATSGQEEKMLLSNFEKLDYTDVVKFVAGSVEELERALEIVRTYKVECNIYISPVFGKIDPKDMVKFLIDNKLNNWKLQLQLHKIIWAPDKRCV